MNLNFFKASNKEFVIDKKNKADWLLVFSCLIIGVAGLITMNSFTGEDNYFSKQVLWLAISFGFYFLFSRVDWGFLRRTNIIVIFYSSGLFLLLLLFAIGNIAKGAQSWFSFGGVSFQPAEFMKLAVIMILAKYFSRRHIEIANFRHIFVSGIYAFIAFVLITLQPDFGSAAIVFLIWLGMVLVSGISKKHLFVVFLIGALTFSGLWFFAFKDYQKARIRSFVNPLADIQKSGYNAYQSMVAVGSGQILGKGVGYGTQSRLKFLPEYRTDFIFAAFAEEWGFVGVLILFLSFGVLVWRILLNAARGSTNFEVLFGAGVAVYIISHFFVNVGMNIGVLPVTGVTLPFMSYGGTHLLIEFGTLGILAGMSRHSSSIKREILDSQLV